MTADEQLLAALRRSRATFLAGVRGFSQDVARIRVVDGEWSIIEILAHMVAVDDCYLAQALDVSENPGISFSYFDDDAWKALRPGPDGFVLREVLTQLAESHDRVLSSTAKLSQAQLRRSCAHPRGILYTARDILLRLPAHDANHQRQIEELRLALRA